MSSGSYGSSRSSGSSRSRTDKIMNYRYALQTKNIQIETLYSFLWWPHVPTLWWRWCHSVMVSRHSQISPDSVSWAAGHSIGTYISAQYRASFIEQTTETTVQTFDISVPDCLEHFVGHAFKFRKMKFLTTDNIITSPDPCVCIQIRG